MLTCTPPHHLLDQFTQLFPYFLIWNGDLEKSSVDFVHFCVFGKGRLDDENILDFVLDTEVQLQSLQK
jgi:hypothetical protein